MLSLREAGSIFPSIVEASIAIVNPAWNLPFLGSAVLVATGFRLLFADWRGWIIAWFALVWVANHLIGVYGRMRLGIRSERLEIDLKEEAVSEQSGVSKLDDRANKPRLEDRGSKPRKAS